MGEGELVGYFKLKHDIQNDSELPLARAEIESSIGAGVEEVRNAADVLVDELRFLMDRRLRIHDRICWHPYPGALEGFLTRGLEPNPELLEAIRRLSYFREVYLAWERDDDSPAEDMGLRPGAGGSEVSLDPLTTLYRLEGGRCLRVVPDQAAYEFSDFVCRLARDDSDVERMFRAGLRHLRVGVKRAYSAESARLFKTIEDFMDDRRAPQLYLTHWFFGIRGKFFPRMIRAAINLMGLREGDLVLDPFTGCGTLNVEASLMGIRSVGVEVNPLLAMVSRVKVRALGADPSEVSKLISRVEEELRSRPAADGLSLEEALSRLPERLASRVRRGSLAVVVRVLEISQSVGDPELSDFLKVPLAYWMRSMLTKQAPEKVISTYLDHLKRMWFALRFLQLYRENVRPIEPAKAEVIRGDSTRLREVLRQVPGELRGPFDGVVTSPPYLAAIDYVGNQLYSLYVLGLTSDHLAVDRETLGSMRGSRSREWSESALDSLPEDVRDFLLWLRPGRPKMSAALLRYFLGVLRVFKEIGEVLRPGGRVTGVSGAERVRGVRGEGRGLPVADWMTELASQVGLEPEVRFDVHLAKSSERGAIPTESLVVLRKP
ncbi:MAG: DNA methyltransferase [Candidatus Korarchaeota archaeon]|nr:DNA methyltransferase [Candidatus Korarchaeota archaeon]